MFGLKRRIPPTKGFTHADGCRLVRADPGVEVEWSYEGDGLWRAECVCSVEYFRDPPEAGARQDPRDPQLARHLPQCEYAHELDAGRLKYVLKVRDGRSDGYWWVECAVCETGWQVFHYPIEEDPNPGPWQPPRDLLK